MNLIHVKECNNGHGLFASEEIRVGARILTFKGRTIDFSQAIKNKEEGHLLQIGEKQYLIPEPPGRFTNHNCNPNSAIKDTTTLIAIKTIKKDEEITFDYSTTMDEDYWMMDCNCSSKNCRGKITDFKYLPKNIQKKYLQLGIVPKWLLKKLEM